MIVYTTNGTSNITFNAPGVEIPAKHDGPCKFTPICEEEPTHLICERCADDCCEWE